MASVYRASVNRASLAVSIGISRYAFYGFADLYLIFVSLCEATLRANSSVVQVFYNLMFKRISYWKVSTISPPVLGYTPLILWSVDVSEPSMLSTLRVATRASACKRVYYIDLLIE
jgi:hypothetical protein